MLAPFHLTSPISVMVKELLLVWGSLGIPFLQGGWLLPLYPLALPKGKCCLSHHRDSRPSSPLCRIALPQRPALMTQLTKRVQRVWREGRLSARQREALGVCISITILYKVLTFNCSPGLPILLAALKTDKCDPNCTCWAMGTDGARLVPKQKEVIPESCELLNSRM